MKHIKQKRFNHVIELIQFSFYRSYVVTNEYGVYVFQRENLFSIKFSGLYDNYVWGFRKPLFMNQFYINFQKTTGFYITN